MSVRGKSRNRVLIMYTRKEMSHMKLFICVIVLAVTSGLGNNLLSQQIEQSFDQQQIIDLNEKDLELKVFPNPTPDYVTISSNLRIEGYYKLSNIVGKIIVEGEIEDRSEKIDLLEYRTGVYIISIYNRKGKKLATRKIIKN